MRDTKTLRRLAASISLGLSLSVPVWGQELAPLELDALGLMNGRLVEVDASSDDPVFSVPVDLPSGESGVLELESSSPRAADFRLFHSGSDGGLEELIPEPARTYRGVLRVAGVVRGSAAASVLDDGVYANVSADDPGDDFSLQPTREPDGVRHAAFAGSEVIPEENRTCGANGFESELDFSESTPQVWEAGTSGVSLLHVVDLVVDVDYEYYLTYGSVANVQDRVDTLINLLNVQYERDVGVRYVLSSLVVRDDPDDPYTSTDPNELLDEVQNEWRGDGLTRDLVHLFTGKELDGSVIGIAYIGVVCNKNFMWGLSQVDFSGNVNSSTDLLAHELGHNFNADHCACTSYTMNPYITTSNVFHSSQSIPDIISHRDSVGCLDTVPGGDDTTEPTVAFTFPSDGSVVSSNPTMLVTAGDDSGIDEVQFFLDGSSTPFATDSAPPYVVVFDLASVADGYHLITATATDNSSNSNQSSDVISLTVLTTRQADPGFAYVDVNGDGKFFADDNDVILALGLITDGVFDTRKSEGAYSGQPDVGLVIPLSVGTVSSMSGSGLRLRADRDVTVRASLSASDLNASIVIKSRRGDVVLGEPEAPRITLSAPRMVQVGASVSVDGDEVDFGSGRVFIKGGVDVNLDSGAVTADSDVRLRASSEVILNNFDIDTTLEKSKALVKGGVRVVGTNASISSTKVQIKSSGALDFDNCQIKACGSSSGKVVCGGSTTSTLLNSTVVAALHVLVKQGGLDLTNSTVANTSTVGNVLVKAVTVTVDGATILDGGNDGGPVIKGISVGTPASLGPGTVGCP